MPIELNDIRSGYNLAAINENFQRIENEWDEKLDRLTSTQGNQMEQALDMNGHPILNVSVSGTDPGSLLTVSAGDSRYLRKQGAVAQDLRVSKIPTAGTDVVRLQDISPLTPTSVTQVAWTGDVHLLGGSIWPVSSLEDAAVGNTGLSGVDFLRLGGNLYQLSPGNASGEITALSQTNRTATIGGTSYTLVRKAQSFDSVADAVAAMGLTVNQIITVPDYYGTTNPSGSGEMVFRVVASGTGTADGGRYINGIGVQLEQIFENGVPSLKKYGGRAEGTMGFDNATAFQNCINLNNSMILDQDTRGYLIGTSINCTDRFSGSTIICPGHVGNNNLGTYLMGNTGEAPVLDFTGSERNYLQGFGVRSATGNTNPSALGMLFARSTVVQFAQFNQLNNIVVNMDVSTTAFGGRGSVGIYNIASEIFTFRDVYGIANTGVYIGSDNLFGVSSSYATLNTAISSTSTMYFEGTCVFDSRGDRGVPCRFRGAQVGTGTMYVNGRNGAVNDPDSVGVRFDGSCTNWDATFFLEFAVHNAYIENGFRDNKIKFLGQVTANRYVLSNAGFTGVTDCTFESKRTVSGTFTPPDYFITGDTSDVFRRCKFILDYDPAVDFVRPTNLQSNRVLCEFSGATQKTIDMTELSSTVVNIVRSDTRTGASITYGAGVSPEGVVTANVGSLHLANIGAIGRHYVKRTGTGNTGWVELRIV